MNLAAVLFTALAALQPSAQIEPEVTVLPPPVTCTAGPYTATVGVDHQTLTSILVVDDLTDSIECTLPYTITAGGYSVGDPVWNGHSADLPTLYVCSVLFTGHDDQRDCVRVAVCESGSLAQSIGVVSTTDDHGRWQHHGRYIPQRLAAVGHPDGDPQDLWINGLMTRHVYDQWGGTWAAWSCAAKVSAR